MLIKNFESVKTKQIHLYNNQYNFRAVEIINLFIEQMQSMCNDYMNKISKMQQWQLKSLLPKEIEIVNAEEQKKYLLERYQKHNRLYSILKDDLNLIKQNDKISFSKLRIANVDHRYLESIGLKEDQIGSFYNFINSIRS